MADRRRRLLGLAGALTAAVLLLAGCGSSSTSLVSGVSTPGNHGYLGDYLDPPFVVPDVALTDTGGKPFSVAASPEKLKIVFFGYTKCPDVCQIMMSTINAALVRFDADRRKQIEVVFVTTDPARDTEKVLREYLDRFDPSYIGLTGTIPAIARLGAPLKVYFDKGKQLASGGYEVEHSTQVYGVTAGNQVRLIWTQGISPAQLATDITKLLKS